MDILAAVRTRSSMASHSHVLSSWSDLLLIIICFTSHAACHRPIPAGFLISDGIGIGPANYTAESSSFMSLIRLNSTITSCDPAYGFLPCATTALGNTFLILVYAYLMFLAAKQLSAGSEILLEILGPGLIGGLLLPLLSCLPDAAIILASGLSGTQETAQTQVSVGMGLLAGSTVMLLTILWGSCLLLGKCDIEASMAVDSKDSSAFSLTGSGVSTDKWTSYAARIMIVSIAPLLVVQLPRLFSLSASAARSAVLTSLIVAISLLLSYGTYQVYQPWMQRRKLAAINYRRLISNFLSTLSTSALGRLFKDDGSPNVPVLEKLFHIIDQDSDGHLSPAELRAFLLGLHLDEMDMDMDDAVDRLIKDLDAAHDSVIHKDEFVHRISTWLQQLQHSATNINVDGSSHHTSPRTPRLLAYYDRRIMREQHLLGLDDDPADKSQRRTSIQTAALKAVALLLLGTAVAAAFADPLVDAVDNFSTASGIPTFSVSFVILPFASSSEVVSAMISASRKTTKTASLTYSEIYGSVTMSNILSVAVFLGLVYFRQLSWDFSAEVVAIILVCVFMGGIGSFRTTFPLWIALLAFAFYPLSLVIVYLLDNFFGWS